MVLLLSLMLITTVPHVIADPVRSVFCIREARGMFARPYGFQLCSIRPGRCEAQDMKPSGNTSSAPTNQSLGRCHACKGPSRRTYAPLLWGIMGLWWGSGAKIAGRRQLQTRRGSFNLIGTDPRCESISQEWRVDPGGLESKKAACQQ